MYNLMITDDDCVGTRWQDSITIGVYNAQALANIYGKMNQFTRPSCNRNPLELNQLLNMSSKNTKWGLWVNQHNFISISVTHIFYFNVKCEFLMTSQVIY